MWAYSRSWMLFCNSPGGTPRGMAQHLVFLKPSGLWESSDFCTSLLSSCSLSSSLLCLRVEAFFLFIFPHLLGRPSFLYNFVIAPFRIFHRFFVMLVAGVTSSSGRSLLSPANERMLAPREYFAINKKDFTSERYRTDFTLFSCLVLL